jgi:DNA repair exonuclease SbcCD ATPase subunit
MKLVSIELKNYRLHRHLKEKFSEHLTGIVGANGSGKSCILEAIRWLLTGVNSYKGTAKKCISQFAGADEEASGLLVFTHGIYTFEVKRFLRPAKEKGRLRVFTRRGRCCEEVVGDSKVTPRIFEFLNTNQETLNNYVLVSQGDMFSFIDEQPAKRAKAFQRLFRLENILTAHEALSQAANAVQLPDMAIDRDQLMSEIAQVEQQIAEATAQRDVVHMPPNFDQLQAADLQICNEWQTKCGWLHNSADCQQQLDAVNAQLAETGDGAEQEMAYNMLKEAVAANDTVYESAKAALANWGQYQQLMQAREDLQTKIRDAETFITNNAAPETPAGYPGDEGMSNWHHQLTEKNHDIRIKENFVKTFKDTSGRCPTCQQPVSNFEERLQQTQDEVAQLTAEAAELATTYNSFLNYQSRLHGWENHQQSQEENLKTYRVMLEQQPAPAEQQLDAAGVRQTVTTHEQRVSTLQSQGLAQQQLREAKARLEGQRQQIQATKDNADAEAAKYAVTEEEARFAHATYTDRQNDQAQWTANNQSVALYTAKLTEKQNILTQLDASFQRRKQLEAWLEYLEELKSVTGREGLPKFIAYNRLCELQVGMNNLLDTFDEEFRVTADESLSFQAEFVDGRKHAADDLSGGQKVILAVSCRTSVNSMFASEVGVLLLDEPTVYLDADHVTQFAEVLRRLRDVAASRGLQLILITHERELNPLFDKVISL